MTTQRSLFAPPARCPCCGSPAVVAVDLDLVGECRDCDAVLWRDDDQTPWEAFVGAFGRPKPRTRQKGKQGASRGSPEKDPS